jgi:hypothetical protein
MVLVTDVGLTVAAPGVAVTAPYSTVEVIADALTEMDDVKVGVPKVLAEVRLSVVAVISPGLTVGSPTVTPFIRLVGATATVGLPTVQVLLIPVGLATSLSRRTLSLFSKRTTSPPSRRRRSTSRA